MNTLLQIQGSDWVHPANLARTLNLDLHGCAKPEPGLDLNLWVRFRFGPGSQGPGLDRSQTMSDQVSDICC